MAQREDLIGDKSSPVVEDRTGETEVNQVQMDEVLIIDENESSGLTYEGKVLFKQPCTVRGDFVVKTGELNEVKVEAPEGFTIEGDGIVEGSIAAKYLVCQMLLVDSDVIIEGDLTTKMLFVKGNLKIQGNLVAEGVIVLGYLQVDKDINVRESISARKDIICNGKINCYDGINCDESIIHYEGIRTSVIHVGSRIECVNKIPCPVIFKQLFVIAEPTQEKYLDLLCIRLKWWLEENKEKTEIAETFWERLDSTRGILKKADYPGYRDRCR
jgi:cytoskeletal protein CcmA (bactofilin family)